MAERPIELKIDVPPELEGGTYANVLNVVNPPQKPTVRPAHRRGTGGRGENLHERPEHERAGDVHAESAPGEGRGMPAAGHHSGTVACERTGDASQRYGNTSHRGWRFQSL